MTPHQEAMQTMSLVFTIGGLILCFVAGSVSGLLGRRPVDGQSKRFSVGQSRSRGERSADKRP